MHEMLCMLEAYTSEVLFSNSYCIIICKLIDFFDHHIQERLIVFADDVRATITCPK